MQFSKGKNYSSAKAMPEGGQRPKHTCGLEVWAHNLGSLYSLNLEVPRWIKLPVPLFINTLISFLLCMLLKYAPLRGSYHLHHGMSIALSNARWSLTQIEFPLQLCLEAVICYPPGFGHVCAVSSDLLARPSRCDLPPMR